MKKIASLLLRLVEIVCVCLLVVILLAMCIQIVCRTFSIGISWTEELARIAFILLIFLGSPLALAEGSHIAVDMLVNALPAPLKKWVEAIASVAVAIFAGCCIRSVLVVRKASVGVTAVAMTWLKMNWIYNAMLASFIALLLVAVIQTLCLILGRPALLQLHPAEENPQEEVDLGL